MKLEIWNDSLRSSRQARSPGDFNRTQSVRDRSPTAARDSALDLLQAYGWTFGRAVERKFLIALPAIVSF